MAEKAVSRETIFALRKTIARLENEKLPGLVGLAKKADPAGFRQKAADRLDADGYKALALGVPDLDRLLGGGLPLEGLTEIRTQQTRDGGAAAGFTLALASLCQGRSQDPALAAPVLWIGQSLAATEAGLPYAVGLQAHGLDVRRFFLSTPRNVQDALWIAEAALSVPVFAAVILEVRGNPACFGLQESRRLHLRARAGGTPFFLLRQAGTEEASSAVFRLHVLPAPAARRCLADGSPLPGSIGNPIFHVTVEKSRSLSPSAIFMEWNPHERRFSQLDGQAAGAAAKSPSAHPLPHLSAPAGRQDGADQMGRVVALKRAS